MRRSLDDLSSSMVKKDNYSCLPDELKDFNYWLADTGHVIMAIPEALLSDAEKNGDLDLYECACPCKYVLESGYRLYKDHVIVNASYDEDLGLVVDDKYYEY